MSSSSILQWHSRCKISTLSRMGRSLYSLSPCIGFHFSPKYSQRHSRCSFRKNVQFSSLREREGEGGRGREREGEGRRRRETRREEGERRKGRERRIYYHTNYGCRDGPGKSCQCSTWLPFWCGVVFLYSTDSTNEG